VAAATIELIKKPKLSDDDLLALLPAPDYPGGGQIISSAAEIADAYRTGRGSLKVRARWSIEDLARGQWQLVVHELPPGASAQKVLEEIEELTNPKVKTGKKSLSQDQLSLKQTVLSVLDAVRDESSKDAAVRLVFEPKTRTVEVQELANVLLAHTSLETTAPLNLTMVGRDGKPVQKNLRQVITEWIDFRLVTVQRRTRHRLNKVLDRIHVLEGRQLVLLNIDEVIAIIRQADDPKAALIKRFKLTDRQADDILDIRLRQLAKLEAIKIEQELKSLREEQANLQDLLDNEASLRKSVIKEIEVDAKTYGDKRRTLIQEDKRSVAEVKVLDEPVTVIASLKGWVRTMKGHEVDAAALSFKSGDGLYGTFACRTVDSMMVLGSSGRVYTVAVAALPGGRGDGTPVTALIDLEAGSQAQHFLVAPPDTMLLLATTAGFGLMARVGDMQSRQRAGKAFVTVDGGVFMLPPSIVSEEHANVACLSQSGRLLVFQLDEIKHQANGGRGLTLMDVDTKDPMISVTAFGDALTVEGTGRGGKSKREVLRGQSVGDHEGRRARKGKKVAGFVKPLRLKA
jgi:topoisomerase IV subunit A